MRRFPSSLLQFTPRNRLPSLFAIGMLVGAAWYFSVEFEPSVLGLLLLAAPMSGAVLFAHLRGRNVGVLAVSIIALGVVSGALSGSVATLRLGHAQIQAPIGPVLLEGWVHSAEPAKRGVRLVIRVHAIDALDEALTPETVRLTHISKLQTEPGRFVRCWAVLRPPPAPVIVGDYAFDRHAWYEKLGAVGYVQGRCRSGTLGSPISGISVAELQIGRWRRQLAQHVNAAAGARAGGLAAALASGDRSFLSDGDQTALRGAGLAHLLAISGLHIGLVGGLVYLLIWRGLALIEPIALRINVKRPAAFGALVACGSYMIISGASVSTQRAFMMAVVFFGAILIDRAALTQRSLAIAMIAIIFLAPWSVLTPGFQMSFAATAVLIATYEAWQDRSERQQGRARNGVLFWIKSIVVTSTVTSLSTAPFAIYHFERFAGFGVLANILAMPIVSLMSAPSAAIALILAPVGGDDWALRAFGWSLEGILTIAHMVDARSIQSGLTVPKMPAFSLSLFSVALIVICLVRGVRKRFSSAAIPGLVALVVWAGSAADKVHWAPSGDVFLEQASGRVIRIELLPGAGLGPLRFSHLAITDGCQMGEACAFTFRRQSIVFVANSAALDCRTFETADLILLQSPQSKCPIGRHQTVIQWRDVQRENGVTLVWRSGTLRKQVKPVCGTRRWRPCRRGKTAE